jgi:multidrug resistance efflux pump
MAKENTTMRRIILVPVLIIVALLAIIGGVGYWIYNGYMYYGTDDAQVSGQIVNVSAPTAGQLQTFTMKRGDTVTAGQTIGTISESGAATTATAPRTTSVNITSPISGTILQTSAVQGQSVTPGLSIVQLTNLSNVNITAYVDENSINNVKVGQDVDVKVDAYSDTTYTGHVQQIVQAAASTFSLLPTQDNASGNFTKVSQRIPVIINIDGNGGKALLPGMSANVTIHIH